MPVVGVVVGIVDAAVGIVDAAVVTGVCWTVVILCVVAVGVDAAVVEVVCWVVVFVCVVGGVFVVGAVGGDDKTKLLTPQIRK